MKYLLPVVACLGMLPIAQGQSLGQWMKAKKWDAAKSGALIALDGDFLQPRPNSGQGRTGSELDPYRRKLVRLGGLWAIVPTERLSLRLNALPNPYDTLSQNDKFALFFGTLSDAQWAQITQTGIAPSDLSGQQRLLLQALMPHPFYAQEFVYENDGLGSNGDPQLVSPEAAFRTKLQVFKTLDVGYGAMVESTSKTQMWRGVSSSNYRAQGSHVYRAVEAPADNRQGLYSGTIEPNAEKTSQLDMKQATLQKPVSIAEQETIGDVFAAIRSATGVEVYPDRRISRFHLNVVGDHANAADLLRAVALCVSGAYRRVGPAFVLAPDVEGQATRATQAAANEAIAKMSFQTEVAQARENLKKARVLDKLAFRSDDPFEGAAILNMLRLPTSTYAQGAWAPEGTANDTIRQAIPNFGQVPAPRDGEVGNQHWVPDPEKLHQVHYAVSVSYRFILPNKQIIDSQPLDLDRGVQYGGAPAPKAHFPLDTATLPAGSTVGYATENPEDAKAFCALAKDHGFKTVWMETTNPDVLKTVEDSGLGVNLILRPWRRFKGENGEVDVNVLGQSGADLNEIPVARMDYGRNVTWTYSDSLSPAASDLTAHWDRLVRLASDKRLHGVLLLDVIPGGYDGPSERDYEGVPTEPLYYNGQPVSRNLSDLVRLVYEFGYTPALRLALLRKAGIDPIDVEPTARKFPFAPLPYFERGPFGNDLYPMTPPGLDETTAAYTAFEKVRNEAAVKAVHRLLERLKVVEHPIWMQFKSGNDNLVQIPLTLGPADTFDQPYASEHDSAEILPIEPLVAEDSAGIVQYVLKVKLDKQTCFSFAGVPPKKLNAYFRYFFKPQVK